jgi:hypothetical protein
MKPSEQIVLRRVQFGFYVLQVAGNVVPNRSVKTSRVTFLFHSGGQIVRQSAHVLRELCPKHVTEMVKHFERAAVFFVSGFSVAVAPPVRALRNSGLNNGIG